VQPDIAALLNLPKTIITTGFPSGIQLGDGFLAVPFPICRMDPLFYLGKIFNPNSSPIITTSISILLIF
jgi:hypothetical protein